jgi:hypothetical protein
MYNEELIEKQRRWSSQALGLMRELLPLVGPIGRAERWTAEERATITELLTAIARSTESVLLLCAYGQVWDAELVVRSVFEGTLKFAYLLQAPATFKQRHNEYRRDLFQIGLLRDHQKALALLAAIPNRDAEEWRPIRDRLLSEREHEEISQRYPKDVRRVMEMRWGFAGLIRELQSDRKFGSVGGLAHGYSIASHIQHVDYIGISVPMERDLRSDDRRNFIHMAHIVRLISDVFGCLTIRLATGYRFVEQDLAPIKAAIDRVEVFMKPLGGAYQEWLEVEYGNAAP